MDQRIGKALKRAKADEVSSLIKLVSDLRDNKIIKHAPKQPCIQKLIRFIWVETNPKQARRWVTVLLLSLVHRYDTLKNRILHLDQELPLLGHLALSENVELRILLGSLIANVIHSKLELSSFWPKADSLSVRLERFPTNLKSPTDWLLDFDSFHTESVSREGRKFVAPPGIFYACALEIDDGNTSSFQSQNGILCGIVQCGLTIVSGPPALEVQLFLDIASSSMKSVGATIRILKDSQGASVIHVPVVEIHLLDGHECILNSKSRPAKKVTILFERTSTADATAAMLKAAIERESQPRSSSSQALDVSAELTRERPSALPSVSASSPHVVLGEPEVLPSVNKESRPSRIRTERNPPQLPGKLARLSSALSPEPDEPVRAVGISQLRNGTGYVKVNGVKGKAFEPNAPSHWMTSRLDIPTNSSVISDIGHCADDPRTDVYNVPSSTDSSEATSGVKSKSRKRKTIGGASKKPAPKRIKRKACPGKYDDTNAEHQASQPLDIVPGFGQESTRLKLRMGRMQVGDGPTDVSKSRGKTVTVVSEDIVAESLDTTHEAVSIHYQSPAQVLDLSRTKMTIQAVRKGKGNAIVSDDMNSEVVNKTISNEDIDDLRQKARLMELMKDMPTFGTQVDPVAISSDLESNEGGDSLRTTDDCRQDHGLHVDEYGFEQEVVKVPVEKQSAAAATMEYGDIIRPSEILIDEQSTRKAKLITFNKKGPGNQGRLRDARILSTPQNNTSFSALARSSPAKVHDDAEIPFVGFIKLAAVMKSDSEQAVPRVDALVAKPVLYMVPAKHVQHSASHETYPKDRRPKIPKDESRPDRWHEFPTERIDPQNDWEQLSAMKVSDDDFVAVEDVLAQPLHTQEPIRRASQRSVRVTDEGSPMVEFQELLSTNFEETSRDRTIGRSPIVLRPLRKAHEAQNTAIGTTQVVRLQCSRTGKVNGVKNVTPLSRDFVASKTSQAWMQDPAKVTQKSSPDTVYGCIRGNPKTVECRGPFSSDGMTEGGANKTFLDGLKMVKSSLTKVPIMRMPNHERERTAFHSSSDSELDEETLVDEVDEAELEWENALLPRHLELIYVLNRLTRRLVAHIMDSETPVAEIIDQFADKASYITLNLEEQYIEKCKKYLVHSVDPKDDAVKAQVNAAKQLKDCHAEVRAWTRTELSTWQQSQDLAMDQIRRLEARI